MYQVLVKMKFRKIKLKIQYEENVKIMMKIYYLKDCHVMIQFPSTQIRK